MKVRIDFKNRNHSPEKWSINTLLPNFNAHADDKKAVRKAVMEELGKKYPKAKGFVQGITVIQRKM
jgi:hypothetical protein